MTRDMGFHLAVKLQEAQVMLLHNQVMYQLMLLHMAALYPLLPLMKAVEEEGKEEHLSEAK